MGTKELNVLLQKELNPEEVDKDEKEFGEIKFREQDRVMQTKIITICYGKKTMIEHLEKN